MWASGAGDRNNNGKEKRTWVAWQLLFESRRVLAWLRSWFFFLVFFSDYEAAKSRRDVDQDTMDKLLAEATKTLQEP